MGWRSVSEKHWVAGGYASGHGVAHTEGSCTKNTGHFSGDTGSPAGGSHDDERAVVRRNY